MKLKIRAINNIMLKRLFPKSLFARFILIIMVPTIMAQLVATYIFYNRHWQNVSSHMIDSLVGEISTIVKIREKHYSAKIEDLLEHELPLTITVLSKNKSFSTENSPESLKPLYDSLAKKINFPFNIQFDEEENNIFITIKTKQDILLIKTSRKRIDNSTTHIFILWMTGTSAIFFLLSLLFLKNQIRPIVKLARAAEQFGKGQKISHLKPSGALEVRKAANAFLKMKERLERQISQRTEMLSGISHDLRTPLTRIKLQLEMSYDEAAEDMKEDVLEMESMINSYLNFARGIGIENVAKVEIHKFISNIVNTYEKQRNNITIVNNNKIIFLLKAQSIKRVLKNLIDNSIKYATLIEISYKIHNDLLYITIEDNGKGIPATQYKNVFKPFYRIDNSRNNETGGIGLGLAIVRDIINEHGGEVILANSKKLGGLEVRISIPV